jgi:cytochrome c-type biogenesis protein CcmH
MGPGGIDWVSAVVVLVAGLALGAVFVWKMRAGGAAAPSPPASSLERRDLMGRREVLLRQLAELEDTAAKRSPEQLARERYALELDTARVLRELDRLPAAEAAAAPSERAPAPPTAGADEPPPAGRPALRGFLWGTGSMAALAGLVFLVTQAARPREPGGSPTGELPSVSPAPPTTADETRLLAILQRNPDDLDARLALAHSYLQQQDMMAVWEETQYVLERSPGHPRALSYQSLVRLAMGQPEIALEMLEQAIATAPDLVEAYVPMSLVLMRLGRPEDAARTMAEARRRFPEQVEALARFESQLRAAAGEGPASLEGDPHAGIAPPSAEGPASGRPPDRVTSARPGSTVSGLVDLDPALRGQVSSGVLFLIVREAGVEGGPPLAVQRLVPRSLPLRFEIGEDDSMTGEALPDELLLEARLDSDGDPSSRPATDPRAREDHVELGRSDLELVLRRAN